MNRSNPRGLQFVPAILGKLVSPAASQTIREIFVTPENPLDDIKLAKGLSGRNVQIIRPLNK